MQVGVVGGGTMGIGIAHAFAVSGVRVSVVEPAAAQREAVLEQIGAVLDAGVERGRLEADEAAEARDLVTVLGAVDELATELGLVIEAVPEQPELKHQVLRAIEARRPALIGSNTSSLSISGLASVLEQPEAFVGTHFFNPVWAMKLVELVVGERTADATTDAVRKTMTAIGKDVIVVKDTPGFATSRLGVLLGLEAIRMLEAGVASAEDIDKALVLGYGHPMGPLRLTDLVGLDVRLAVARYLHGELGERFAPPATLERMVAEGRLGKKTGRGFYDW